MAGSRGLLGIVAQHGALVESSSSALAVTPPRSSASRIAASRTVSDVPSSSAMPSSLVARASVACCKRRRAAACTCGAAPPCDRHTVVPCTAYRLHGSPLVRRAVHLTGAGRPFFGLLRRVDRSAGSRVVLQSIVRLHAAALQMPSLAARRPSNVRRTTRATDATIRHHER